MSDTPHAVVENAAEPDQVRRATRRQRRAVDARHELVAQQMATTRGREFVWELVKDALVECSGPMELMALAAAERNVPVRLLREVIAEHGAAYVQMVTEANARYARTQQEIDALHTPSAEGATT